MSTNNKAKRAKRKKEREKVQRQRRAVPDQGYGKPDPDSGGRYLKQPGVKYADEPEIQVKCRDCQYVVHVPVAAMVIEPDYAVAEESDAFNIVCTRCGTAVPVKPRVEHLQDGTTLLWTDRTVVEEYQGEDVRQFLFENRKSGAKVTLTRGAPDFEGWAICDNCHLPFIAKGALAWTMDANHDEYPAEDFKVSPCTHCGGVGVPILLRVEHDGLVTYGNSPGFADRVAVTLADQVASGQIDLKTAVRELRKTKNPILGRIASWIESRPVSAMAVATVLQIAAGLLGPHIFDGDQPGQTPPPTGRYTDEQVEKIISTILEHYDQRLEEQPPANPKPRAKGRKP